MHKFVKAVAFDFGHTLVDERFPEGRTHLMPGVREVLPQIHQPIAVWANTRAVDEMEVRSRLRDALIERYFSSVITSIDAGFRKPAPEFFQFALARWNFAKDDILFVGNQLNTDIIGAQRFGIRTAWLSAPEFRSHDETMTLADAQPSFIISDLMQLPSLLQTISVRASSSA